MPRGAAREDRADPPRGVARAAPVAEISYEGGSSFYSFEVRVRPPPPPPPFVLIGHAVSFTPY